MDNDIAKLDRRRRTFLQKTNEMEWGENQPQDFEKRDWIGSTADRYAEKRMAEDAVANADLR